MWKVPSSIKKTPKHFWCLCGFLFSFLFFLYIEFGPGKANIEGFVAAGTGFDF